MGPDPKAEAARWFEQAEADFETARRLAEIGIFYAACFFAQQAAEKALKAAHFAAGARVVLGHSVGALARATLPFAPSIAALADTIERLDLFYIPTRYPNSLPESVPARVFKREDAATATDLAGRTLDAVRTWLASASLETP